MNTLFLCRNNIDHEIWKDNTHAAEFCKECDEWIVDKCTSHFCHFCRERPEKPSQAKHPELQVCMEKMEP